MPYDKTRNNQSVQKAPYVRPPRTRKHIPCHCQECKGKLIDPKTKKKHNSRFTNRIIPQRGYTNLTETPNDNHSPINLIPSPEIVMNINNEEDHEENLQKESYQFLVKRASILGVQKNNRMSTFTTLEVINELLSDDDNVSEDERRELEDKSDDQYSWIVIWILKYQERFQLSNVATDFLFKFFHYILVNINENLYSRFSTSLYMVRKKLGFCVHIIKYAACNKCCKLYNIDDISSSKPAVAPKFTECTYQDFSDHPISNKRNPCGATLYKNVYTKDDPEILADVYDGKVWKSFKDENGSQFFRPNSSDTHLGIMLNERFKLANILTLAMIPGPTKPKLHQLNHYLAPLVDQLIELWQGIELETFEYPNGKIVKKAVICCSCNIPAARKLCGYISARVACHRCLKQANYDGNQPNFGGFSDMDSWFIERDVKEI
ncbi:hypothetical protein RhiirA5_431735 [Rhizophagus irregularis]|uniref:Transposase domain-containing protein n=1 Tax=Rhizophagus irregularis TaxID=588596 RepID=A0A2N0NUI4_9GLOM|nr:hypothetical protein RhiirA5_431735 [Rhizophagus irregularis]